MDKASQIASAIIEMFRWDGPSLQIVPLIKVVDSSEAHIEQLLNAAGRPGETGYRMTWLSARDEVRWSECHRLYNALYKGGRQSCRLSNAM